MKILWFGNSSDQRGRVEDGVMTHNVLARELEAATGELVEIVVRPIWPNGRMVSYIERCLDEVQPDIVMLRANTFWFGYESIPLRLNRWFGPAAKPLRKMGLGGASSSWLGERAVFHWTRDALHGLIGGDTYFTPEVLIERQTAAIRAVVRREGVAAVIHGPSGRKPLHRSRKANERIEVKRKKVHAALKELCEESHLPYISSEEARYLQGEAWSSLGDRLHGDAASLRRRADEDFEPLMEAWRQVRG